MQPTPIATRPHPTARRADGPNLVDLRTPVYWAMLGVLFVIYSLNLTWAMTAPTFGDWDEGRHAVTAIEMFRSGDLLVNTYRGAVDYWNLKPPLSFWPIIASLHVFGVDVFALRLPAVLESFATGVVLTVFARRRLGRVGAVATAAAYATCYPLIGSHSGRTADPDALYVFFFTVGLLSVFTAAERPRFLLLWTVAFSGAFLTKSWHAGLILVVGALFLLVRGRRGTARRRDYLIALVGFVPILLWAIARYSFDGTAFFTGMVQYDLLSRSSTALEGNGGGPLYYVIRLTYFVPWLLLVIPFLVTAGRRRGLGGALRRWRSSEWIGPLLCVVTVIGLFSAASSKLAWYVYPIFPALALLTGVVVSSIARDAGRGVRILLCATAVVATLACEAYVIDKIPAPSPGTQQALTELDADPAVEGLPIYLDPALALSGNDQAERRLAKIGDWPQSLRASAVVNGDLEPAEGGTDAFLSGSDRRLMLVQKDSAAARASTAAGASTVAEDDGFTVVELP